MYVLFVYKVKLKGSTMQKLMTSTTKEEEGLLKIHANLFMYTSTLHLYTIYTAYCIVVLYMIQENTIQVQTCIKDLQGRMENKAMCVCSHMLFCASLSGSGVGGGLHQWVCSPAGQTVGGHEWVELR